MSAPTVAGVAALLWHRNLHEGLELGAADVAALAMNYSTPVIKIGRNTTGPLGAIARQGAGRTDAWQSATSDTLVRTDAGFAALGYSNLFALEDDVTRITRTLSVRNLSATPKSYRPSSRLVFDNDAGKGISFSFDPPTLSVPALQTADLKVILEADGADLRAWPNRAANWISNEAFLAEYEMDGHVTLTEIDAQGKAVTDGDVAGVPFYVLPRRRACVSSETTGPFTPDRRGALRGSRRERPARVLGRPGAVAGEQARLDGANRPPPAVGWCVLEALAVALGRANQPH